MNFALVSRGYRRHPAGVLVHNCTPPRVGPPRRRINVSPVESAQSGPRVGNWTRGLIIALPIEGSTIGLRICRAPCRPPLAPVQFEEARKQRRKRRVNWSGLVACLRKYDCPSNEYRIGNAGQVWRHAPLTGVVDWHH